MHTYVHVLNYHVVYIIDSVDSQPEEQAGVWHGEGREVLHGLEGGVQRVASVPVEFARAAQVGR